MTRRTKIGWSPHAGMPNNSRGAGEFYMEMARQGHTLYAKTVRNSGLIMDMQAAMDAYPDTVGLACWRMDTFQPDGRDVPNYNADPYQEAVRMWTQARDAFPPELWKHTTYIEFPNEISRQEFEWLGEYCYHVGTMAVNDGYKYCALGVNSGEPGEDMGNAADTWESIVDAWKLMEPYLRLCAQYPDNLAVSVHEYTFDKNIPILDGVPWLHGRCMAINHACQDLGIAPPKIFVTEGGWGRDNAPNYSQGIPQILDIFDYYHKKIPNVAGYTTWCIDTGSDYNWGNIADIINEYMKPYAIPAYFEGHSFPEPEEPHQPPPQAEQAHGVDISHHQQTGIDWDQMQAQGVDSLYIRASYGISGVDSHFISHWNGSANRTWLRGAYHYMWNNQPGDEQADHFLNSLIDMDSGKLPVVLDLEDTINGRASVSNILAFVNRIKERHNKDVIIYTAAWWWDDFAYWDSSFSDRQTIANKCLLWVANYTTANEPTIPSSWQSWEQWQYSAQGNALGGQYGLNCGGVECDIDLNHWNMTRAEFYEKYDSSPGTPPIEKPDGVNMVANWSFENEDWETLPDKNQRPQNWSIQYVEPGEGQVRGRPVTVTPECVHKYCEQLPADECVGGSDAVILDGQLVYKIFHRNGVWDATLSQVVSGFDPGVRVKVIVPWQCHFDGRSDNHDPDDVIIDILCNDERNITHMGNSLDRTWQYAEIDCYADAAGDVVLSINITNKWEHHTSLFIDAVEAIQELLVEPPVEPPIDPPPVEKSKIVIFKYAQEHDFDTYIGIAEEAFAEYKRTVTASHDDTMTMLSVGNDESYAVVWDSWLPSQEQMIAMLEAAGFYYQERNTTTPPSDDFYMSHWPTDYRHVTQRFAANYDYYHDLNPQLHGHEGVDIRAPHGSPVYAVATGGVSDIRDGDTGHAYGTFVRISHKDGYETTYAHLERRVVGIGEPVEAGQLIGYADDTGNSQGSHLHLTLKRHGHTYTDQYGQVWPYNIHNPEPFMEHFDNVYWPPNPDPPPPTTPPGGGRYDLKGYIIGDGRLYEVANANGGQERFQSQDKDNDEYWQTKNTLAEQFYIDNDYIWRGWDTSPGNNRYYVQQQPKGSNAAKWMPRMMNIGDTYAVSLWVQFYNWDCTESEPNSGAVTDTRKFVAHHGTWTSRAGVTLNDVIEIHWTNGGEKYFYCKNYGLVAWERIHQDPHTPQWSAISEIHAPGQRPDNVAQLPSCL